MIDALVEKLEKMLDEEFDFNLEHWENGNFDDSFEYGVETGQQETVREILKFIKNQ